MNKYTITEFTKKNVLKYFQKDLTGKKLSHTVLTLTPVLIDFKNDASNAPTANSLLNQYEAHATSLTDRNALYAVLTEQFIATHFPNPMTCKDFTRFFRSIIEQSRTDIDLVADLFNHYGATNYKEMEAQFLSDLKSRRKPIERYSKFAKVIALSKDYSIKANRVQRKANGIEYFGFKVFQGKSDITKKITLLNLNAKHYQRTDLDDDQTVISVDTDFKATAKMLFKEIMLNNDLAGLFDRDKAQQRVFQTERQLDATLSIRTYGIKVNGRDKTVLKVFYREIDITGILTFDKVKPTRVHRFDDTFQASVMISKGNTIDLLESEVRRLNCDLFSSFQCTAQNTKLSFVSIKKKEENE